MDKNEIEKLANEVVLRRRQSYETRDVVTSLERRLENLKGRLFRFNEAESISFAQLVKILKPILPTDRAPHCDQFVMHAPGKCEFCDDCPEAQRARVAYGVNFTGENDPAKMSCPAELFRPKERIDAWYGNQAKPTRAEWFE